MLIKLQKLKQRGALSPHTDGGDWRADSRGGAKIDGTTDIIHNCFVWSLLTNRAATHFITLFSFNSIASFAPFWLIQKFTYLTSAGGSPV